MQSPQAEWPALDAQWSVLQSSLDAGSLNAHEAVLTLAEAACRVSHTVLAKKAISTLSTLPPFPT